MAKTDKIKATDIFDEKIVALIKNNHKGLKKIIHTATIAEKAMENLKLAIEEIGITFDD